MKRGSSGKLLHTIALQGMKEPGLSSARPCFRAEIESILGEEQR